MVKRWSPTPQLRGDSSDRIDMYYVYALKSLKDGKLYIGCTSNLILRCKQHSEGRVKSTKNRRPFVLAYSESYLNKKDAARRERYFKNGGKAHNFLKEQIKK